MTSGDVHINKKPVAVATGAIFTIALFTNQYFHGGLYGPLHNDSLEPVLTASGARVDANTLQFDLSRTAGPDTCGSFLVDVAVVDTQTGNRPIDLGGRSLGALPTADIINRHIVQVHVGQRSLVVPLGAKARLRIDIGDKHLDPLHRYLLTLTDISGLKWTSNVQVSP